MSGMLSASLEYYCGVRDAMSEAAFSRCTATCSISPTDRRGRSRSARKR